MGQIIGYLTGGVVGTLVALHIWGFTTPGGIIMLAGAAGGGVSGYFLGRDRSTFASGALGWALLRMLFYSAGMFGISFLLFMLLFALRECSLATALFLSTVATAAFSLVQTSILLPLFRHRT